LTASSSVLFHAAADLMTTLTFDDEDESFCRRSAETFCLPADDCARVAPGHVTARTTTATAAMQAMGDVSLSLLILQ
jgi:hypothetical protein